MSVDAATVKRIGRLARIRIEEAEVETYQAELNTILGFVEQLSEVDVTGVEPMTSVTPMSLRRREDKVTDGGYPEKIVANAPLSRGQFLHGAQGRRVSVMAISVAVESPLQDDVRELVALLNEHLLPLSPIEFQFKMTVEQMAGADTTVFVARDESGRAVGMRRAQGAFDRAGRGQAHVHAAGSARTAGRIGAAGGHRGAGVEKGISQLMLETGTGPGFDGAVGSTPTADFTPRGAFLDYPDSEWSAFFEKRLTAHATA